MIVIVGLLPLMFSFFCNGWSRTLGQAGASGSIPRKRTEASEEQSNIDRPSKSPRVAQQEAELRGWPCKLPLWNYCEPPACRSYLEFMAKYKITGVISKGTTGSVRAGIKEFCFPARQHYQNHTTKTHALQMGMKSEILRIALYIIHR